MLRFYPYLLLPLVSLALVSAQTLWAGAVKSQGIFSTNDPVRIFLAIIGNEKIWLGALLYLATTGLYFFLFSKLPFFVIQISVTAMAIIFSTLIATFFFHEAITITNLLGIALVASGLGLLFLR